MSEDRIDVSRRNVLSTIGTTSIGVFGVSGLSRNARANGTICGTDTGIECGAGRSPYFLGSDLNAYTTDGSDGEFNLESSIYASEYNSWHDQDYCEYTHRIHIGVTGNAFVDDGSEYLDKKAVASNELAIDVTGDLENTRQPKHEEAIGAYESFEEQKFESDHYEGLADAVVSGAVGVATAAAFSNPASGIIASMAFSYLTSHVADENNHEYELMWDWDSGVGDLGEGVEDCSMFARLDVTTRIGDSATVTADALATGFGGASAISNLDFTVTAPSTCEDSSSLTHRSLSEKGHIKITADELTAEQQDTLLGRKPKKALNEKGYLIVKRDTIVGRTIEKLRSQR